MRLVANGQTSRSLLLLQNQPLRGVRVTMPRHLLYPLPLDAPSVPAVTYRGSSATAANSCPRSCSSRRTLVSISHGFTPARRTLVSIAHGCTPAERLSAVVASPVAVPLPKILTAPMVFPPRRRLLHLRPPRSWRLLGSALAASRCPLCCSSHR